MDLQLTITKKFTMEMERMYTVSTKLLARLENMVRSLLALLLLTQRPDKLDLICSLF